MEGVDEIEGALFFFLLFLFLTPTYRWPAPTGACLFDLLACRFGCAVGFFFSFSSLLFLLAFVYNGHGQIPTLFSMMDVYGGMRGWRWKRGSEERVV